MVLAVISDDGPTSWRKTTDDSIVDGTNERGALCLSKTSHVCFLCTSFALLIGTLHRHQTSGMVACQSSRRCRQRHRPACSHQNSREVCRQSPTGTTTTLEATFVPPIHCFRVRAGNCSTETEAQNRRSQASRAFHARMNRPMQDARWANHLCRSRACTTPRALFILKQDPSCASQIQTPHPGHFSSEL